MKTDNDDRLLGDPEVRGGSQAARKSTCNTCHSFQHVATKFTTTHKKKSPPFLFIWHIMSVTRATTSPHLYNDVTTLACIQENGVVGLFKQKASEMKK